MEGDSVFLYMTAQNTSDHFPVTTTLYACPKKKPATCDSIPKLKIDWDKVDKEEYKKNVLVELEDFRYLKMKTPYGVEQSITHVRILPFSIGKMFFLIWRQLLLI
jgi:hypothetical protein